MLYNSSMSRSLGCFLKRERGRTSPSNPDFSQDSRHFPSPSRRGLKLLHGCCSPVFSGAEGCCQGCGWLPWGRGVLTIALWFEKLVGNVSCFLDTKNQRFPLNSLNKMCLCHITVKTHFRTLGYATFIYVPNPQCFLVTPVNVSLPHIREDTFPHAGL